MQSRICIWFSVFPPSSGKIHGLDTENQIRTNNTSTKMKLTKCKDDILQWKLNDLCILKVEQFDVFILLFLDPEIHLMCKQSDKVYTVIFISKSDFFLRKFLSSIHVEFRVLLYSMLGSKFHVLFCRHFEHLYFKNWAKNSDIEIKKI